MLDPAIQDFLSKRLKHIPNPSASELKQELDDWLPKAAKNARKLFRVTHPVKFSHPDTKNTSEIRAASKYRADGFLRTGNTSVEFDTIFDTSANIPIWKFLSLQLIDGQSVLEHLEKDSDSIKQQLAIPSMPFVEIQQGLLAITELSNAIKTSGKLKQVYFPISEGYHLLSILTPSGLMFKLKECINIIRFSEDAKLAREHRRNQQHHEQGFDELYDLTVIGFGGTKPQNISVLNNQNGGTAYLLSSMPPPLKLRGLHPPKTNFFNSLYYKNYQDSFKSLDKLLQADHNNANIREGRDNLLHFIIQQAMDEQVTEKLWQLRQLEMGWSAKTNLSMAQKIWLDNAHLEQRENDSAWLDEVIGDFARWIVFAYQKTIGKEQAIPLGDIELAHFKQLLTDYREDLR